MESVNGLQRSEDGRKCVTLRDDESSSRLDMCRRVEFKISIL